jgi:O-antigen/teichoic acid export membrane protein
LNLKTAYQKVKKYLNNILWIMGDKVTNLGVSFFVTVVVARYLGPEEFGLFSYAISVSSLFAAAGHMGLSGLVVREVVKRPDERGTTLGTTLGLKLIGMGGGYLLLLLYAGLYEGISSIEFVLLATAGAVLLLRPFDIVDFWFQAFVQARYVSFARISGLLISSALKVSCVFLGASVIYFVAANVIQALVVAAMLLVLYSAKSSVKFSEWNFSWTRAKELFGQGWMVYLGSIFAVIYLKVDQVMLRWFEGSESVGIYAVAAQFSEAWYFVPAAIVTSVFPKLMKLREQSQKEFDRRFQQLLDLLLILALTIALIMTFASEFLVTTFFGEHYLESADILVIHIWAALFIFMRAAFSKWILIENVLVFSLITQGLGSGANVILNYFLIPEYGVTGAAFATLISYSFASFFSLALYPKTRPVFFMMVKSFLFAFRYAKLGQKR